MKKRAPVKGIIVVILFLIFTISVVKQIQTIRRIDNEISTKNEELQNIKETNQKLQAELQRAQSNSEYLERLARERLGMIKDGEKVVLPSDGGQ